MQYYKTHFCNPILLLFVFIFTVNLFVSISYKFYSPNNFERHHTLYGSDARGYYEYLEWGISGKNINYESGNSYKRGNGRILKYTYGTAAFQLPFYCISKVIDTNKTFEFTKTDEFFITLGASLYIALAIVLLYKLLGRFSSNTITKTTSVLLIYLATNLFHYSSIELMMSHLYSFLSITGYLYYVMQYNETRRNHHLLLSLLFLFLIIAIRPFNAIIVFPIICYQFFKLKSFKIASLSGCIIILSFCIQLLLWRLQCGIWTFASYDGEGFYWSNPQFFNVLFSFRKGLFIYSPIILIAFAGLFFKWKSDTNLKITLLLICLIFIYAVSCWWHWPYGDSFGHRAFIDIYAIAAIGLVILMDSIKRFVIKILGSIFLILFMLLNLFQTWQYNHFILPPEYTTYDKYKYLFLNTDDPSINCLGGPKDIFPFKQPYKLITDSLPYMKMDGLEYSTAFDYFNNIEDYKGCYVDVSFIKEESLANQSNRAGLYYQIFDEHGNSSFFYGICINETPNDFLKPNSKQFSYQITISALKNKEKLRVVFGNPERKNFTLKNIVVKRYLFSN